MELQDQQNVINNNLNNEIKKEEEKKEDFKVTKKIIAGRELIAVEGGIYMQKLTEKDLKELEGGQTISGTLINGINSIVKTIYGWGQNFGSACRRIVSGNMCSF